MKQFPKFWYESNACWGWVNSIEDLQEKCNLQTAPHTGSVANKDEFLDRSRQNIDGSENFGTRREHTGKKTLREYLTENGISF